MKNPGVKFGESGEKMTCAEFQKVLPEIFEHGGDPTQHEHFKTCEVCSDLVADLNYIAEQAKLLLPLRDPGPRVWNNIQESLEQEGLVKQSSRAAHGAAKKKF